MSDAGMLRLPEAMEEVRPYLNEMHEAIDLVRPATSPDATLIDYGCGTGRWIPATQDKFAQVIGLDVDSMALAQAQILLDINHLQNVRLINRSKQPLESIPQADAIICIDAITLMRCDHAHEMFAIARSHLAQGGRFLLCARRAASMVDQILTLERFKYDGIAGGLRRYAALIRSALESVLFPRIRRIPRGRIYYHRNAIPMLAAEYGFSMELGPAELAKMAAIARLEWSFKGNGTERRRFRWFNWYLLHKD